MDKPIKVSIAEWIYKHLGDDFWNDGWQGPPGTLPKLEFGTLGDDGRPSQVATTYNNDGFELWLGTRHKWHVFYDAAEARKLAWFILWTWWAKSTWFGLKRKLWYWGLSTHLDYWRPIWRKHADEYQQNAACNKS